MVQMIEDKLIANEVIISHGKYFIFEEVNNPGFNRARVHINAIFTPAHSNGVSVELFYGNHRIGEIIKLRAPNGSGLGASEPFDIGYLSSFKFVVRNHDSSQDTTIRNFKAVMYNEWTVTR